MLRVTAVDRHVRAPYTVAEAEVAARWLGSHGVEPVRYDGLDQDELGVWRSPSGARVLWFEDPDGNLRSMTQM